jgi:DNA-binding HxlR family transcriptional regulator
MIAISDPPIRSARQGMRLLRPELNRALLQALGTRPMSIGDLCAHLMLESDTTLREQLDQLEATSVIERKTEAQAQTAELLLTRAGDDLLSVISLVGAWLGRRPARPLSPESDAAWRAFAALGDGWERSLIQHLLLRPSTRGELLEKIPSLTRGKSKRMLRRLQGAGLLRPLDSDKPVPRYALTVWAREAIAILAAIAHWERAHLPGGAEPIAASDAAIGLLGALPLIRTHPDVSGIGAFTVEAEAREPTHGASAVWACFVRGGVSVCRPGSCPKPPDAWVHGRVDAWIEAVVDGRPAALHLGGDRSLGGGAIHGLHEELFGVWISSGRLRRGRGFVTPR